MTLSYAVVTPARDEVENLPRLAASLAAQTVTPKAWYIVDNGSTDGTFEVATGIAMDREWVHVLSLPGSAVADRGAPVVRALRAGISALEPAPPDVIVNVDADISFGAEYFDLLLRRFDADARLGIASGSAYEVEGGEWRQRFVTGTTVWGASRAYRWECLQAVLPLEERVGWDGVDELRANARGWHTQAFEDLPFRHHRREGERDGTAWKARLNQGRAAHYLGYRPWYLLLRSLWHMRREPAALGLVWGYAGAALRQEARNSDPAARAYLRRQQSPRNLRIRAFEARGRRNGRPDMRQLREGAIGVGEGGGPREASAVMVDVVVVTYLSADSVANAVRPLATTGSARVIVVDNASTDGTLDVLAALPVETIALDDNVGFARGCNVGAALGNAPYVLLLNPDARLDPDSLHVLVAELERGERVGAVAPRIAEANGALDFSLRRFPRLRSGFGQALFFHRFFPEAAWVDEVVRDRSEYESAHPVEWASGACLLVRRSVLERMGGLDETFFLYSEDVDLCARIWQSGYEVRFTPSALAVHEGGRSAPRAQLLPLLAASRIRYSAKHDRVAATVLVRAAVALGALTHAVVARGRNARRGHLRAFVVALRPLPTEPRRLIADS